MLPHEKALVKRMADKPFALIGINSDGPAEKVKPQFKEHGITWRNGIEERKMTLSNNWGINGFPTLFLIDGDGKIRHKWLGSPGDEAIDEAADTLVAELLTKKRVER